MTNYKLHNDCKILSQRVYPENRLEATNGWSHKGTYSNNRTGFYSEIYTKDNKAILVIRGTELHSGINETSKDVLSDLRMGLGYLPHQMQDAEKAYIETIREYGKDNVILTGHSLGGSEAQILGTKYGVETVTFEAYGTKNFNGVEVNYTDNITNYGNAQDGIFIKNIDNQIGKTMVLNSNAKTGDIFEKGYKYHGIEPHNIENLEDLSKAVEYKKEAFEQNKTPLFKTGIEYIDYSDDVFDTKNRILYKGEVALENMDDKLLDVYLDQYYGNGTMPTKEELDKRVHVGELIYVEEYTRSDGTKVSGYYRRP